MGGDQAAPHKVIPLSSELLHHLHTDPTSHHITLSASPSNRQAQPIIPLEPTVTELQKPDASPSRPPLKRLASSVGSQTSAAGSSRSPLLRSGSSKRRPQTAPGKPEEDLPSSRIPESIDGSEHDVGSYPSSEGSACLAAFAQDELMATGAFEMLSLGSGSNSTILLGRAGTLRPASSPRTDWHSFSAAYAEGRFDPNAIPDPPIPADSPPDLPSAQSSPGVKYNHLPEKSRPQPSSSDTSGASSGGSSMTTTSSAPSTSNSSIPSDHGPSSQSTASAMVGRRRPFVSSASQHPLNPSSGLNIPSYSFAAATVRMASSNLTGANLAPLAIPSPERELMDPMASIVSPGAIPSSASSDPGSSKHSLARSLSHAPTYSSIPRLPPILASPTTTPRDSPRGEAVPPRLKGGLVNSRIPPASAPLEKSIETDDTTDYFGAVSPRFPRQPSGTSSSSQTVTGTSPSRSIPNTPPPPPGAKAPLTDDLPIPPTALPAQIGPLYEQYGWLPAPIPPNELLRRKALYRYNILHTAPDINFDRIAHMAKLVFNPKIVLVALVEGDSQWHKTETGLGAAEASRISSFCSHSLLAR
ncbi:hypothetical protein P7C73_g108, partial [Tremellales sp. Uapishka_1]